MKEHADAAPNWLCYLDLACALLAAGLWYLLPGAGPWPLVLALVPWAIRFVLTGQPTRRTAFDLPILIFLVTAGLAVWAAYDRTAAWPKFWLILGSALLFYAFANAEPVPRVRVWILALLGTAVAAYLLLTHDWDLYPAKIPALTTLGQALQAPLPRLPGHRLHPNVAGGLMAMSVPFAGLAAAQSWRDQKTGEGRSWLSLAAALVALAVTLFGLLLTTSRAAWIALAAALFLTILWAVAGWLSPRGKGRQGRLFAGLAAGALAIALVVVLVWPGGVAALMETLPGENTIVGRADLLRATPSLIRDYPLIGAGLGGFQMLYSTYVLLSHVGYTVHSHNLYLDVAVEQGLPALLALVWMWILFAVAVWRGLLRRGPRRGSGALGAAALSLVIILIHGMVDDVLYGSRGVMLLLVPLAFAVPFLRRERLADRRLTWLLPAGLILLIGLALLFRGPVLSRFSSNLGAIHQSRAELGPYSWPEWPIQDEVRRQADLSRPVAQFERALAFDPDNAAANRRLGMIELSLAQYGSALAHLEAAYALEPESVTTRQLYGEALIANGRLEEGQELWADVNTEQGQLDARIFWYEHIGDEERAQMMRRAAESQ